ILTHMGRFTPAMTAMLENAVPGVAFVPSGEGASSDVLVVMLDDREARNGVVEAMTPEVRWVHVFNAGMDRFPLHAAGRRVITGSRGAAAPAIAEWVLAMMLAFAKQLPASWVTGPPEHWGAAGLSVLRNNTLGLIGFGEIGREVARRALAFDMNVVAVRRTRAPSEIPGVEVVGSLGELLGAADHVVVTAPATPATRHLLNAKAFARMKPGAHLVNIARGTLIDQDALIAALDDGTVAMASLDVVDPEPLPAGHPLYAHPKVRVSPHISWSSPDTIMRTVEIFADNLRRYEAGEELRGVVDVTEGY
ncbi:MAG: NAD(P)-dependent oxidoreductase, partial [Actinomycetota bacterium]